jgi:hypothetical protein
MLIHQNGALYPIEVKKNVSLSNTKFTGFQFLNACGQPILNPCVVNLGQELTYIKGDIQVIPIGYL